jgi:hypothetical protein
MSAVAARLDQVIKSLPPDRAASVEKLVWDVIQVIEPLPGEDADRQARLASHREHIRRSVDEARTLDWSGFERPPQEELEKRQDW